MKLNDLWEVAHKFAPGSKGGKPSTWLLVILSPVQLARVKQRPVHSSIPHGMKRSALGKVLDERTVFRTPVVPRTPPLTDFTPRERRLVRELRTPVLVQRYLRDLPYNWSDSLSSFRGVVRSGRAQCLEGVLFAAAVLEQHGYPPVIIDLESQDRLDHVLFLFRGPAGWGSLGRSRDEGLHGRKPVFRTVRALVRSYMDPYVDGQGRITAYGVVHLDQLVHTDWRLSTRNVPGVERALITMRHVRVKMPDAQYDRALRRFRAFKAKHPAPSGRDWRNHLRTQSQRWL